MKQAKEETEEQTRLMALRVRLVVVSIFYQYSGGAQE